MLRAKFTLAVLAASLIAAGSAWACHVGGNVYCDGTGQPLAGIRIDLVATDGTDYARYAVSNELGRYDIALLCEPHCYRITASTPNGEVVIFPFVRLVRFLRRRQQQLRRRASRLAHRQPGLPAGRGEVGLLAHRGRREVRRPARRQRRLQAVQLGRQRLPRLRPDAR